MLPIALFSCSDEFVNEKTTVSGVANSAIILSPDWEADNYQFTIDGVEEADFTITSQPEWLILESKTGRITDSLATIYGSVITVPRFSTPGVYIDQMMVTVNGNPYAVPVYYITEGTPAVQVSRTLIIDYNNYNNQLTISNSGNGVLLWDIVRLPPWLRLDLNLFNPSSLLLGNGANAQVPLILDVENAIQSNPAGTIVLKTNDPDHPRVEIAVSVYLGTPQLNYYDRQVNFETSQTTKSINFSNFGNGILTWKFEGLPQWLAVTKTSGTLMPYYSTNEIFFSCNTAFLRPGLNSATIYLKTNDPDEPSIAIPVSVRAPGTSENIRAVEGNILDAAFDKSTDILYYVTGQPNQLVAWDVTTRTILHQVALDKTPTSLAIDEDFTKALVGHGGLISQVDLTSFQVSKTFEMNATIYDLEWALGDWFCYTTTASNVFSLLWLNSTTGETYESPQSPINYSLGTASLKKIPGQPYLLASRKDLSPSGIFVFNLNTKALKSYSHESMNNAWFFSDNTLMVTGASAILRTSAVIATSGNQIYGPSAIGQLKTGDYAQIAWWIDYSAANNSLWALFSYYSFSLYPPVDGMIYQFEDNDYILVKTHAYDNLYQPDAQTTAYKVQAHYVFANNAGTELSVLRRGENNTTWSIEFLEVK